MRAQIQTRNDGWKLLRKITAVDTALAAGTFDSKPAGAVILPEIGEAKEIKLMFCGVGSADDANTINIYTGRHALRGPAEFLGQFTVTLGTMVVNNDPAAGENVGSLDFFADTIAVVTNIGDIDAVIGGDQGNDRIAKMYVDPQEAKWMYVDCTSLGSTELHVFYTRLAAGV